MKTRTYLDKLEDMTDKKVIVTGGTSGIGLSLVKHLLSKNAKVVIMARNMFKAEEVKNKLLKIYPHAHISFIEYDQSNKTSVINACQEIIINHGDFYALILNAGLIQSKKATTYINDIPLTIYTNFVANSIIINRLLYKLNGHHRIIIQGSLVAGLKMKEINTLKLHDLSAIKQYVISKMGVESLFYYYANHTNDNLSFYLVEPGITNSEIIRDFPTIIIKLGHVFLKLFSHSTEKAALTALKALQSDSGPGSYIIPRGFLSFMGYPKYRLFPERRKRSYLIDLLNEIE